MESMDRISQFPHPILQHILCFLSQKDATRTCVLSKSWRNLWSSRPKVEFRKSSFEGNWETFISALDDTLQRYHHQNLSIQQFHLEMSNSLCELELFVKWIPILLTNMGVEMLDITITETPAVPLPLTDVVFGAEFLKELNLQICRLERCNFFDVRLKRLRNLSFYGVHLEDETFEKIMEGCPLVERVSLIFCTGLRTAKVNKGRNTINYLKHFGCCLSCDVEIYFPVAIERLNIISCDSIKFTCCPSNEYYYFPRLKSIYISGVHLPRGLFNSYSCDFPCLEHLELFGCSGFKHFKLLGPSIKRLKISDMKKLIKTIAIDAPNILYFKYTCLFSLPSFSFTTASSRDWESCVSVPFQLRNSSNEVMEWFLKLSELLKGLRDSRITLSLFNHRMAKRHFIDTTHVGLYEPVALEQLSLKDFYSLGSFATLFDGLFRILRPRYIHINDTCLYKSKTKRKNQLADFICKTNQKEGDFSRCYFWHQDLKEFRMEILDENSKNWCLVDSSCLTKAQLRREIRFRFEWRERSPACLEF